MSEPFIVRGETICKQCGTHKYWAFTVERAKPGEHETTESIARRTVVRQFREVSSKDHMDHLDQLTATNTLNFDPIKAMEAAR